jgi:hypothetical protein
MRMSCCTIWSLVKGALSDATSVVLFNAVQHFDVTNFWRSLIPSNNLDITTLVEMEKEKCSYRQWLILCVLILFCSISRFYIYLMKVMHGIIFVASFLYFPCRIGPRIKDEHTCISGGREWWIQNLNPWISEWLGWRNVHFVVCCVFKSSTLYKFSRVSYVPLYIVRNIK